jgi:signal transduction histidine kinase
MSMTRDWKFEAGRVAAICAAGVVALLALSYLCFRLKFGLTQAGFTLLVAVTLIALLRSYVASIVVSLAAFAGLNYFFTPPLFTLWVADPDDISALVAFLTTSLIVAGLTTQIQRLAEQKLAKTRAELTHFARIATLGELTASIVHEVNQPLAGVVSSGNACQRWLASDPPNVERAAQSVERMIRDANRAHEVVERVRSMARKTPPQKAPVDVNEALSEVAALARGDIEGKRVVLRLQLAADLPIVQADRIQLQQVLLNLIVNAIESISSAADGPRELTVTTGQNGAGQVKFAVRDTGQGLNNETLPHIFDAFYTTKGEGMGMGLAVSRAIIEAHGGRLWAEPVEPRGALFQFTMPADR